MSDDDDREYEVGKGKPPKWTRFIKGNSGNPNGRPPKRKAPAPAGDSGLDDVLRALLERKVAVTQGGKQREIKTSELLLNAHIKAAAGGSPIALRDMEQQMRALEERDARRRQAKEAKKLADYRRGVEFKKAMALSWAEAIRNGSEPADPWPHPDDILIDHTMQTWSVRGPLFDQELPRFEYYQAERDAAFLANMIELRTCLISRCGKLTVNQIIWMTWDQLLPLRWQIMPRRDAVELTAFCVPLRKLRNEHALAVEDAARLLPGAKMPKREKETYRLVNAVLKPLITRLGYQSLAQLERAEQSEIVAG